MNIYRMLTALRGLNEKKTPPTDIVGHTYADSKSSFCTRCKMEIPARRQYTVAECPGRQSSFDDVATRKIAVDAAGAVAAPVKVR